MVIPACLICSPLYSCRCGYRTWYRSAGTTQVCAIKVSSSSLKDQVLVHWDILSGPAIISSLDSSAASQTTNVAKVITMTSAPSTTPDKRPADILLTTTVPSTISNHLSEMTVTIASQPVISATVSSPVCPADDRLIYIATNKPTPTIGPALEITNSSLAYQIFCYTNYVAKPPIMDVQTLYNLRSLQDCLNACALYSFQTKPVDFPTFACTGIAWEAGTTPICWLKSNVTSLSANGTDEYPGIDGAVMVQWGVILTSVKRRGERSPASYTKLHEVQFKLALQSTNIRP